MQYLPACRAAQITNARSRHLFFCQSPITHCHFVILSEAKNLLNSSLCSKQQFVTPATRLRPTGYGGLNSF